MQGYVFYHQTMTPLCKTQYTTLAQARLQIFRIGKKAQWKKDQYAIFQKQLKKKNCFRVGICRAAPHLPHIPVLYMSFLHVSPVPGNLCLPMEPRTNPEGSKMHILTCFVIQIGLWLLSHNTHLMSLLYVLLLPGFPVAGSPTPLLGSETKTLRVTNVSPCQLQPLHPTTNSPSVSGFDNLPQISQYLHSRKWDHELFSCMNSETACQALALLDYKLQRVTMS